jgi:hypothetical protein
MLSVKGRVAKSKGGSGAGRSLQQEGDDREEAGVGVSMVAGIDIEDGDIDFDGTCRSRRMLMVLSKTCFVLTCFLHAFPAASLAGTNTTQHIEPLQTPASCWGKRSH